MIVEVDPTAGEFRRRAENPEEDARLRREAQILTVARHPGVVQLLGWDGTTLRVQLLPATPPADTTTVAVAVATVLADLHDLGVTHGDLRPEDLRYDDSGAPVLCGFGRTARPAGDDVAALAAIVAPVTDDPGQQQILARAAAATGRRRLSARQLAQLLAQLPARPLTDRPPTRRRRLGSLVGVAGAAPVIGGRRRDASVGLAAAGPAPVVGDRRPRKLVTVVVAATATVVGMGLAGALVWASAAEWAGSGPAKPVVTRCPPVDQGCRPLPHPGGIVTVAAGRYRIGRPGDVVVVGRWGCRRPLAALLEPATGQVWAFPAWAPQGATLAGRLVTAVRGAVSLAVAAAPNGCDRLRVLGPGGAKVDVHPDTGP